MNHKDWWPEEFRKLVTLGASITAGGWSTSPERCWASLLVSMINDYQSKPVALFNAGLGANVISTRSPCYPASGKPAADERLDRDVIAQHPDLLTLAYGLNDARGGTPLALFTEELVSVIRRIRQEIAPLIVLLGPYYVSDEGLKWGEVGWNHADLPTLHRFNQAIAQIAEDEACLYVDILDACDGVDWAIHYDGIHANDLGHRLIANRIFEVLASNCSGLAKHTKEVEKTSPRWRDESMLEAPP